MKQVGLLILGLMLILSLLACSTSSGTLMEESAEGDREDAEERREIRERRRERTEEWELPIFSDDEEEDESYYNPFVFEVRRGVEIRTAPPGADVYLDNRYMGITPLYLEDIEKGRYRLTLKLDDHYPREEWITFAGGYDNYFFQLQEITGFLKINASPADAQVDIDGAWVPADRMLELGIGARRLSFRAFGHKEQTQTVQILDGEITELEVSLEEVPFAITKLRSGKMVFNPRNTGMLGSTRITFRVSGYGTGRAVITASDDEVVFSRDLGRFETWEQNFRWDGLDGKGSPLPDGRYRLIVEGEGERDGRTDSQGLTFYLDSSIMLHFRSLWSGSAGLLYAPATDVLPRGSWQVSSLALAGFGTDSGGAGILRAPLNVGLRHSVGMRNRMELDTAIGGIVGYSSDTLYMPWFLTAALKASLHRPTAAFGVGSAAQIKLALQSSSTDTLANFSGLSAGFPTSLHWGPVSLLISPEVILAPRTVDDPLYDTERGVNGWMYGRLGLIVDLDSFVLGASTSARSQPFNRIAGEGQPLLDLPMQAALEAHYLIPGTQLFVSAAVAGEFRALDDYYLLGGLGLGILN